MHLRGLGLEGGSSHRLSVRAVDGAGNVGPAAEVTVRLAADRVEPLPGRPRELPASPPPKPLPRLGSAEVAVIDELDKVHPTTGALIPPQEKGYLQSNHLWDAATRGVALHAARNEFVAFQVLVRGGTEGRDADLRPALAFDGAGGRKIQVEFGRYHPIPTPASARCPTRSCRWDGARRPRRGLVPAACTSSFTCPTTPPPGRTGAR